MRARKQKCMTHVFVIIFTYNEPLEKVKNRNFAGLTEKISMTEFVICTGLDPRSREIG